jgi:uncharacterized membrane protein
LTAVPAPSTAFEPTRLRDQWRAATAAVILFLIAAALARGGLLTSLHPGDVGHYETFGRRVREGLFPYGAGFYFEYPPFALPVFVLPELISPAHYLLVFKLLMVLCSIGTILATAATLARLRVPEQKTLPLLVVVALAPLLLGSTYLNRYDPWAVLLTSIALLAFVSERVRIGAALLALAFAAKTYPAAIVPVAGIWVFRSEGKRRLIEAAVVFAGTSLLVFGPFAVRAFGGLGNSYYTQAKRSLQIESSGASVLLIADKLGLYSIHWFRGMSVDLAGRAADVVGTLTSVAQVAAILVVAWIYLKSGRRDPQSFLVASAAAVFAFVAFNKVFSQQFAVWLVPFVPLVYGSLVVWTSLLVAGILLATNVDTVWADWGLRNVDWTVWVVAARNIAVVAVLVLLSRELWHRRRLESSP